MAVEITVTVPDNLGRQLEAYRDRLPEVLARGLRELQMDTTPYLTDAASILALVDPSRSLDEILAVRPSEALQDRMGDLLARSRDEGLSQDEETELDRYLYLEHLVRVAKAGALKHSSAAG